MIRNYYLINVIYGGDVFGRELRVYLFILKDLKSDLDIINNFFEIVDIFFNICMYFDVIFLFIYFSDYCLM